MRYNILVKPGSKIAKITPEDDLIIVRTHAKAHDGEANKAVIRQLAEYFQVPKSSISLVRGEKSQHKVIEVG